jgi:hypothetical protein
MMALKNPVAIFTATDNAEAELLRVLLVQSGIEAHSTADLSLIGSWWGGKLPGFHRPQVWIDRSEIEQATPLLKDFEGRSIHRNARTKTSDADAAPIEIVCESCDRRTSFPASQKGSVQACPKCGAYLDVGDVEWDSDWSGDDESGEAEESAEGDTSEKA